MDTAGMTGTVMQRSAFGLLLTGLTLLMACTSLPYEDANHPERDFWQDPAAVIEALQVKEGDRVADLGSGSGYFTFRLSNAVGQTGKVYAVDVDPNSLAFVERHAKARGGIPNVEFILAAPDNPRLPANSIDLLFVSNTYHQLSDRVAYFRGVAQALRRDGRIAVLDYREDDFWASLLGRATRKERVREELEAAGYRLVKEFTFLPKQHFQVFVKLS